MAKVFLSSAEKARKISEKYELNTLPIDVEGLCNIIGIPIHYVDFSSIEKKLERKFLALSQKTMGPVQFLLMMMSQKFVIVLRLHTN